jgi:hypothetical protein
LELLELLERRVPTREVLEVLLYLIPILLGVALVDLLEQLLQLTE